MERRALGKGLDLLIPKTAKTREIVECELSELVAGENQPRRSFDDGKLIELAETIKKSGMIQPIIARRKNDKYEIIVGERRYRAAAVAGIDKVPVILVDANDDEVLEMSVVENLHREDLTPLEIALLIDKLCQKGLTHEEIALKIGKSREWVSNTYRLLNLDDSVKRAIEEGKITQGHAKSLCSLDRKENIEMLLENIIQNKLSVRETEKIARSLSNKEIRKYQKIVDEIKNHFKGFFGRISASVSKKGYTVRIFVELKDGENLLNCLKKVKFKKRSK